MIHPMDIEELLERLMEQMSQFQSLMDSLPGDMRQQLQETMEAALNDPELMQEMAGTFVPHGITDAHAGDAAELPVLRR